MARPYETGLLKLIEIPNLAARLGAMIFKRRFEHDVAELQPVRGHPSNDPHP